MKKRSQEIDSAYKNYMNFYAEDQVGQMRKILSNYWSENLDGDAIASVLLMGNEGYENTSEKELVKEFESVFGENYFSGD